MAIPYASSSSVIIASRQPKPYNVVSLNNNNSTPFLGFSVSAASSSSSSLRATTQRSLQIRCQAQSPTQAEAEAEAPAPTTARTPAIVARIPPEQSWMFEETGFRGPDIWNTTWYPKAADHVMTEKTWYVVDATDKILGRLASAIAIYIRGKNLATFTPSVDMGAFVIVVNAEKVAVSGKKRTQKLYRRHSGRPGGMTVETFDQLQNRIPERIIEHAVRGMLPKGRLGRQLFNHLKVYKGPEHPHEAQKPIDLPLKDKRIQREE